MNKFFVNSILLAICSVLITQPCHGQAELDLPIGTANGLSFGKEVPLRICNPEDNLSNSYCKCTDHVVSCDFSQYSFNSTDVDVDINTTTSYNNETHPTDQQLELTLYGYQFPTTTSRFCICNTPPNVHLTFTKDHFLRPTNKIQRFDLFNLAGVTHFMGGFSINFNGDLYIANVSRIPEIQGYEFSRGDDEPILNVQDQDCCSPIKVNQNYEKPVLFLENSTVDHIRTRGVNGNHLWKTLILKSNTFNTVDYLGFSFEGYAGLNVAILETIFNNVSYYGLLFEDVANLFLAKNIFQYKIAHSNCIKSRSTLNNSNILFIDNMFLNMLYMDLDARHIVSWYNVFDLWDNVTFAPMSETVFSNLIVGGHNRSVSIENNLIWFLENSFDFGNDSKATLSNNVLGTCNCSKLMLFKDKLLSPETNWCYTGRVNKLNGKCSVKLNAASELCEASQSTNFEELCGDKKISVAKFPGRDTNLTQDVGEMQMDSGFISKIVEDFHYIFGMNSIVKLRGIVTDKDATHADGHQDDEHSIVSNGTNAVNNGKHNPPFPNKEASSNYAVPVLVTITVIIFVIVLGTLGYKNKHRFLRRTGHHELMDESSNAMI